MTEGQVVRGRGDHLVLHTLAVSVAHAREAEAVEDVRMFVVRSIEVYRAGGSGDQGILWDERAIGKCEVLQRLAGHRHCTSRNQVGIYSARAK